MRYNDFLDGNIALVTSRLASVRDVDKRLVYYMDSRFDDAYHTVGVGEIQETWIKLAGGIFATEDLSGRNLLITAEKLLSIDPDIIFIGSGAYDPYITRQMLESDPALVNLKAVRNNDIVIMPKGIFAWCRTGPEFCMQMVWAAKFLYPDKFEDIDVVQMTKNFYRDFYGTNVSDENIAKILAGKMPPAGM
jgi:iron complex transport system substrate-binding protein